MEFKEWTREELRREDLMSERSHLLSQYWESQDLEESFPIGFREDPQVMQERLRIRRRLNEITDELGWMRLF